VLRNRGLACAFLVLIVPLSDAVTAEHVSRAGTKRGTITAKHMECRKQAGSKTEVFAGPRSPLPDLCASTLPAGVM
jgi:hypothetical protein